MFALLKQHPPVVENTCGMALQPLVELNRTIQEMVKKSGQEAPAQITLAKYSDQIEEEHYTMAMKELTTLDHVEEVLKNHRIKQCTLYKVVKPEGVIRYSKHPDHKQ